MCEPILPFDLFLFILFALELLDVIAIIIYQPFFPVRFIADDVRCAENSWALWILLIFRFYFWLPSFFLPQL